VVLFKIGSYGDMLISYGSDIPNNFQTGKKTVKNSLILRKSSPCQRGKTINAQSEKKVL
jgi:hypothetical protein